jgi:hypothetical protein
MHYIKRLETKKHQSGGLVGDIFVPNTPSGGGGQGGGGGMDLPKIDFSNYAIDIKTTGFLDRMQKVEDMEMKRKRLEFDYKDLEFKQGKEYMDFAAKMIANIRGDVKATSEAGGLADLNPTYRASIDNHNTRTNKIGTDMAKAFMTKQFPQGMQLMSEFSKSPDPEFLKAGVFGKTLNATYENLLKVNAGVMTAKSYDKLTKIATTKFNNMDEAMAALTPVVAEVNQAMALKIESEDVEKYIDETFKIAELGQREKQQVVKNELGEDVVQTVKSTSLMPFDEYLEKAVDLAQVDYRAQYFLDSNGVNYKDRNAVKAFLTSPLKAQWDKTSKTTSTEIESGLTQDRLNAQRSIDPLYAKQKGVAEGITQKEKDKATGGSGGGKRSEAQTTTEALVKDANTRYGTDKFTFDMIRAIEGSKDKKDIPSAIEELAKRLGLSASAGGGKMTEEEMSTMDFIEIDSLDDLEKVYGMPIDKTKVFIEGDNLIVNDKDLNKRLDSNFPRAAQNARKDLNDEEVNKALGYDYSKWNLGTSWFIPEGTPVSGKNKYDTSSVGPATTIYKIKPRKKQTKDNRTNAPKPGYTEMRLEGVENPQDSSKFNQMFNFNNGRD